MADYELLDQNGQPRYITRRVRYFDNQLLVDQDFIDDQKFHIDRQHRHERVLHAAGICDGLQVTPGSLNTVLISPGAALDDLGRQILLEAETPLTVLREGELRLYIRYAEEESDASAQSTGVVGNTRFALKPEIDAVEEASLPVYAVVLGTVVLTLEGVTVRTDGRVYAGIQLPAPAGSPPVELRSAGDGAPGDVVLSGALSVTGELSGAVISTKNSSPGDVRSGVVIDRSGTDVEAGLRFATGDETRWSLKLDQDATEHLRLTSSGGPGTVQQWDYGHGNTTVTGDVSLETGAAWLTGEGTVKLAAGTTDSLAGINTRFQDRLQPGDELLLSGDAATSTPYVVREISGQTGIVLTGALEPIATDTEYTFIYRKNTRKLRFAAVRQALIELDSMASPGSERAFVRFRESGASVESDATSGGRMSIGIYRDSASLEALDLQGGTTLILNAGSWDSELEAAIGASDRTGVAPSLSFRIDDQEKASIDRDGKLSIGDGCAASSAATLLSVGPEGRLTVDSAGALSSLGGLAVGTGPAQFTVDGTGVITGASGLTVGTGANKLTINNSGAITAATGISSSGTVTLSGLGVGSTGTQFLRRGSDNTLTTTSSVDLTSADVSGTLPFSKGGTGALNFTENGVVFGASTTALGSTGAAADSVLVTSSARVPGLSQTLPDAVQGNITKVGAVTSGSIGTGFGSITATRIDATSLATNGTTRIDASGNLSAIADLSASGSISLTGLGAGETGTKFLRLSADNKLATTAGVNLGSGDVSGTLPFARGGTGATTFTSSGVVFAGSDSALSSTAAAASSVLITGADNTPTLSQTLPSAVQKNITALGAVTSGSIGSGFGSISGTTINATTLQTGNTNRIDSSGNLSNIGRISATGAVTLSGLSTGAAGSKFLRLDGSNNVTTTGNVSLTQDVTGTLGYGNGGTGATAFTGNGIVYASGSSSALASTAAAANSVLVTSSASVPALSTTLPEAVQGNITKLGTVTSGTISGISSVSATTVNGTSLQTNGTTRIDSSGNVTGPTLNATTALQTGGTTRLDSSGNLSNIGTITTTGLISTTNSTTGDGVGGIYINRSASDREANIRWATGGATKWFLQMDNDSTEDLRLWSSYFSWWAQKWDYETGNNTIYGDLFLERSGGWVIGTGTVMQGSSDTVITGNGTSFLTTFQVGDEIAFSGVSGTYWIKQVSSDTSLTLTSSVSGLSTTTGVSYNYKKYARKLRFGAASTSMIEFNSNVNYGSDKGFILWKDESSAFITSASSENARLSIGVYNDFYEYHGETLDLQGGYQLILNAGDWDDELDAAIGTPGGTACRGISLRTGNVERALISGSGHFHLNQSVTNECIRMTGNGSNTTPYTIFRNESNNYLAILRYTSGSSDTLKAYVQLNDSSDWVKASDRSLKENIAPLDGALDRLVQLKPVSFDWKAGGPRAMGFIAQDVEAVFPELVSTLTDQDGRPLKGFAETGLTPVAVAAIQELKRQHEAQLSTLEARIAALEAKLCEKG